MHRQSTINLRVSCLLLFVLIQVSFVEASSPYDEELGPPFTSRRRPWLGVPGAPIYVISVEAFSCSHCRAFHERILPVIKREYIDTGFLRWTAIPILSSAGMAPALPDSPSYPASFSPFDPSTRALAIARWAAVNGRFWDIEGFLFFNPPFPLDEFDALLARSKLMTAEEVRKVTAPDSSYYTEVLADLKDCSSAHVSHTPTFLFRRRRANGTLIEARVEGYQPQDYFERLVTQLLSAQ